MYCTGRKIYLGKCVNFNKLSISITFAIKNFDIPVMISDTCIAVKFHFLCVLSYIERSMHSEYFYLYCIMYSNNLSDVWDMCLWGLLHSCYVFVMFFGVFCPLSILLVLIICFNFYLKKKNHMKYQLLRKIC